MDMKTDTITIKEILEIYGFSKMPKGTTEEQWQRYHVDMVAHEKHYLSKQPQRHDYSSEENFNTALSSWRMDYSCFEPNRPGYYRANND